MQPGQVRHNGLFSHAAAIWVMRQSLLRMLRLLIARAALRAGLGETVRNFAGAIRRFILGHR